MRLLDKAKSYNSLVRRIKQSSSTPYEYGELLLAFLKGEIAFTQLVHALQNDKSIRGNRIVSYGAAMSYILRKVKEENSFQRFSFGSSSELFIPASTFKRRVGRPRGKHARHPCIVCGNPASHLRQTCSDRCKWTRISQLRKEYMNTHPELVQKMQRGRREQREAERERITGSALSRIPA